MSGLLLIDKRLPAEERERKTRLALRVFERKRMPVLGSYDVGHFSMTCYAPRGVAIDSQVVRFDDGATGATVAGPFFLDGLHGAEAMERLAREYEPTPQWHHRMQGTYAAVVWRNGKLYVFNDANGLRYFYHNEDHTVFSTSLLAVASTLDKLEPSQSELQEYVLNAGCVHEQTYIKGVKKLPVEQVLDLTNEPTWVSVPSLYRDEWTTHRTREEWLEDCMADQRAYYRMVHKAFGDEISTALSGGYDSRLIFSLLLETGAKPYVYVYGGDMATDARIATLIGQRENYPVHEIKLAQTYSFTPESYLEDAEEEFFYFDGHGKIGGITEGSGLSDRNHCAENSRFFVFGASGEIYRYYWLIRDRAYSPEDIIESRFTAYPETVFRDPGERARQLQFLVEAMSKNLGYKSVPAKVPRHEIEVLLPFFRVRGWGGLDMSVQNQICPGVTPFTEPQFGYKARFIPPHMRRAGEFQAAMIGMAWPSMVTHMSDRGRTLEGRPPFKERFIEWAKEQMPPKMRPWFRMKVLKQGRDSVWQVPFYDLDVWRGIIDFDASRVGEFLRWEELPKSERLNRALTAELVLQDAFGIRKL